MDKKQDKEQTSLSPLKLKGTERTVFAIKSVGIVLLILAVFYLLPSYYGLEILTAKMSLFYLELFGFHPRYFIFEEPLMQLDGIELFLLNFADPIRATYPAISIETTIIPHHYLIVKACTGMQAGALLLGLIWATPAKNTDRIRASYIMLIALFIGNTLRIAAMIAITTILTTDFALDYDTSWNYAHNFMGQPIGFFGTIAFTLVIEKNNVHILDTITTWIDTITAGIQKICSTIK